MQWPQARRVERQARRMHDMIAKVGVDIGKLVRQRDGEAYTEARARCLRCTWTEECLDWLEASAPSCDCPEFCPNARLFGTYVSKAEPVRLQGFPDI